MSENQKKVKVRFSYRPKNDGAMQQDLLEMEMGDFAQQFLEAWKKNPQFRILEYCPARVCTIAAVLGYSISPYHGNLAWSDYDPLVQIEEGFAGCDNLALVSIDLNRSSNQRDYAHFFFWLKRGRWKPLPVAEGWKFSSDSGASNIYGPEGLSFSSRSSCWPWPALFPETFSEVVALSQVLTPGDANALSGLVKSEDPLVRTLAHQLRRTIETTRNSLTARLVATLRSS